MRVYDARRSRSKSPPVNQSEARDSNRGRSERVSRGESERNPNSIKHTFLIDFDKRRSLVSETVELDRYHTHRI